MSKVKIFQGEDTAQTILEELKSSGIVGVSGGRVAARNKLTAVRVLIENEGLKGYFAQSTTNHSDTELGYGYDEARYSKNDAQSFVTQSYDEQM